VIKVVPFGLRWVATAVMCRYVGACGPLSVGSLVQLGTAWEMQNLLALCVDCIKADLALDRPDSFPILQLFDFLCNHGLESGFDECLEVSRDAISRAVAVQL
jgi:hypothetical protein